MNKKEKKLIGALIGLAKACNVHLKTENTDGIIIKSLASIFPLEENGEELFQRVREEKLAVAPDCATCFAPCGNTDEYNLDELQASGISETVRDLKFQLMNVSHEIASGMVSYTIYSTEEIHFGQVTQKAINTIPRIAVAHTRAQSINPILL